MKAIMSWGEIRSYTLKWFVIYLDVVISAPFLIAAVIIAPEMVWSLIVNIYYLLSPLGTSASFILFFLFICILHLVIGKFIFFWTQPAVKKPPRHQENVTIPAPDKQNYYSIRKLLVSEFADGYEAIEAVARQPTPAVAAGLFYARKLRQQSPLHEKEELSEENLADELEIPAFLRR